MIKINFLLVAVSLLALVSCSETVNTIEVNKPSKEWEYEELEYSYRDSFQVRKICTPSRLQDSPKKYLYQVNQGTLRSFQ